MKKYLILMFLTFIVFGVVTSVKAQNELSPDAVEVKIGDEKIMELYSESDIFEYTRNDGVERMRSFLLKPFIVVAVVILIVFIRFIFLYKKNKLQRYKLKFIILSLFAFWVTLIIVVVSSPLMNYVYDLEASDNYYLYDDKSMSFWEVSMRGIKCKNINDCNEVLCESRNGYQDYSICDKSECSCIYGPLGYPVK